MKLKDWIELSTIMGELEGAAMAIEQFRELDEYRLSEFLKKIVVRIEVIKTNTMSEVEEITQSQHNKEERA